MKKSTALFFTVLVSGVAALCLIHQAMAQDMAKVHKGTKLLLENDQVRVLEVTMQPGEKSGMHSHPNHVIYAVKGGTSKSVFADGSSGQIDIKDGEALYRDAITHDTVNVGKDTFKVIVVELKEKK